jgi:NitT/TauT family transport system substrate-binding protein
VRHAFKAIAGLVILGVSTISWAQTPIRLLLDWQVQGPAAPFFLALDKGYYKAEGLDVSIHAGTGSAQTLDQLTKGNFQFGLADTNALVIHRDDPKNPPTKAVMMLYNASAYAMVTLRNKRITAPIDIQRKAVGLPDNPGEELAWNSMVISNKIDPKVVNVDKISFAEREQMLIKGQVDAVMAFWFTTFINLTERGVKAQDIVTFKINDWGVRHYGNAVVANPEFMANNPRAVAGFVKATIRGIQDSLKNPNAAMDALMKFHPNTKRDTEFLRLRLALENNFVTPEIRSTGLLGDVDMKRFAASIDQIDEVLKLKTKPTPATIFTAEFLPPPDQRKWR